MAYYIAIAHFENGKKSKANLDDVFELNEFAEKSRTRGADKIELEKFDETGLIRRGFYYYVESIGRWKSGYISPKK